MKWKKRFWSGFTSLLMVLCLGAFAVCAQAEEASLQTGTAHGSYRDPALGVIEDSGGESNEALGQSMVENVVKGPAMLETAQDGKTYLSIRFGLMDNISETAFSVRYPNESEWTEISASKTAQTENTADFRFAVADSDVTLRADFRVEAMGRSVIFYITADGWSAGNTEGFAELGTAETNDVSNDLANVQGLITGEGSAVQAQAAAQEKEETDETAKSTDNAGEMTLGASVWFMLFCTTFSAVFLAGGCLMLLSSLLQKKHGAVLPAAPEERGEEQTIEPEADNMDFSILFDESSWEEPGDEEAH